MRRSLLVAALAAAVTSIATHSSGQAPLPDLVVRVISFERLQRRPDAPAYVPEFYCELTYEIKNVGSAVAQPKNGPSPYIATSFELGGVRIPGQGIPHRGGLAPQASSKRDVVALFHPGTPCLAGTTVKVMVDPWTEIAESNEANNSATAAAVIGSGTPAPTASAAAASLCLAKRPKPSAAHPRRKTAWPTIGPQGQIVSNVTTVSSSSSAPGTLSQGLAAVIPTLWDTGQTLRVRIDGFSATDTATIQSFAQTWTNVANINFVFVGPNAAAEIRVAPGKGNNSAVGRDNLDVPADQPTMQLVNVTQRAILHEFGHALGWIHEHQSPAAGIKWDKPKVYDHFLATQGWDKATVDENLFKQYAASSTNYSAYDADSIMHYTIDASLTTDGVGVTGKTTLSATDTKYARQWYPFMGDTTGQLRTGDDCDTIDFRIDYNSNDAPANGYRFSLSEAEGKWWKAIKIPLKNGAAFELEVSGSASTASFSADEIDTSRPMGFAKAKFAGVHTWLSYTWPVLGVLPKKTKVQLVWTKDSCGG